MNGNNKHGGSIKVAPSMHYSVVIALIISVITSFLMGILLVETLFKTGLNYFETIRQHTRAIETASGQEIANATVSTAAASGFNLLSEPIVTVYDNITDVSQLPNNTNAQLIKFSVAAADTGPISLAKFTFRIRPSNATITNGTYRLYASYNPLNLGELLSASNDFVVSDDAIEARFDVNNNDPTPHRAEGQTEHYMVWAGGSLYFTLQAVVGGTGFIATELLADDQFVASSPRLLNVIEVDMSPADNFIWSDLNFDLYSTSSATNTAGWFSGYGIGTPQQSMKIEYYYPAPNPDAGTGDDDANQNGKRHRNPGGSGSGSQDEG